MEKNNTHLVGEYFVAAELYRKGFSVGMTIGNAKAIDLFVSKDNHVILLLGLCPHKPFIYGLP